MRHLAVRRPEGKTTASRRRAAEYAAPPRPGVTTQREERENMANINRVVLVGQPDEGSRAAAHAGRHRRLQAPHRGEHAPEGRRHRRVDRQAQLLRRDRLGQPGRELRAVPRQGPPGRDRRPPRLARVGRPGRHEAPGGRDHRRLRAVPRQPRRGRGAVRARRRGAAGRLRLRRPRPTTTSRSDAAHARRQARQRRAAQAARAARDAQIRRRNCYFCREKIDEVDYKNADAAAPVHLREGQDPLAPHHAAPAAATSGSSRSRSSARGRWRSCPYVSRLAMATKIILLTDVENLGLRGDVVDVASGYARNYLLPRRMAEAATPAKWPSSSKPRGAPGAARRAHGDQARDLAGRLEAPSSASTSTPGPTGTLFGSVTPTDIADGSARSPGSASTGARSTWPSRSSASAATRSRSRSSRTSPPPCARSSSRKAASCRPRSRSHREADEAPGAETAVGASRSPRRRSPRRPSRSRSPRQRRPRRRRKGRARPGCPRRARRRDRRRGRRGHHRPDRRARARPSVVRRRQARSGTVPCPQRPPAAVDMAQECPRSDRTICPARLLAVRGQRPGFWG